jgi:hypothetical protein
VSYLAAAIADADGEDVVDDDTASSLPTSGSPASEPSGSMSIPAQEVTAILGDLAVLPRQEASSRKHSLTTSSAGRPRGLKDSGSCASSGKSKSTFHQYTPPSSGRMLSHAAS